MSQTLIIAKCPNGHKTEIFQEQLEKAKELGCFMCHCGLPTFISMIKVKPENKNKK